MNRAGANPRDRLQWLPNSRQITLAGQHDDLYGHGVCIRRSFVNRPFALQRLLLALEAGIIRSQHARAICLGRKLRAEPPG